MADHRDLTERLARVAEILLAEELRIAEEDVAERLSCTA